MRAARLLERGHALAPDLLELVALTAPELEALYYGIRGSVQERALCTLAADPERVAAALGLHLLRQAGVRFDMALGMLTEGDPGVVPAARRIAFEPR